MKSGQRQLLRTMQETPAPSAGGRAYPSAKPRRRARDVAANWLDAATASALAERWEDVVAESSQCLRRDPTCLAALELRAKALWRLGRYRELEGVTQSMLRINQHEPGYRLLQALAQLGMRRFERASAMLRHLVDQCRDSEIRQIAAENLQLLEIHGELMSERLGLAGSAATGAPLGILASSGVGWTQAPLPSPPSAWVLPWRRN